jgi:gelsolin
MADFQKYHIQRGHVMRVPEEMNNDFGDGDCYLIDTGPIIYLWCGSKATVDERFIGAVTSVWRDQAREGVARLITVEARSELPAFLDLFGGNINITDQDTEGILKKVILEKHEYKLFRLNIVGGVHLFIEVPRDRNSLKSDDVYILDTFDKIYIWRGSSSTGREKFHAMLIARRYDYERAGAQNIILVEEGEETKDFLQALE